jgi:hypothetical protein
MVAMNGYDTVDACLVPEARCLFAQADCQSDGPIHRRLFAYPCRGARAFQALGGIHRSG